MLGKDGRGGGGSALARPRAAALAQKMYVVSDDSFLVHS